MRAIWPAAPLLLLAASALLALALAPPGEAHATTTVPSSWPLIPGGLGPGDQFHLLFVTKDNWNSQIDLLNNRSFERLDNAVQNAARHGHGALGPYADQFKVLASCGSTDARHHTSTVPNFYGDVPIYWVRGDKVADNYWDFYDGSWDSLHARSQTGFSWENRGYAAPVTWTGTNTDGTSSRNHVCTDPVTYGYADKYRPGEHFNSYVLWSGSRHSLYGISPVFEVSHAPGAPGKPAVLAVTHDSASISWRAPAQSGSTAIFDYNVQIKRAGESSWVGSTPYHWGTHTNHVLTGLSPETQYQVRVFAKNHGEGGSGVGYGPVSPTATFRTLTTPTGVSADWQLIPDGLGSGDQFRLLFVTSNSRDSFHPSDTPQSFHTFVRNAAGNGHSALDQFSNDFRAVISTRNAPALDNAIMRHSAAVPGVPVYWLDGDKVADDYRDFYDGCWDSNDQRNEDGDSVQGKTWTGSRQDGTTGNFVGRSDPNFGNAGVPCKEMYAGRANSYSHFHVYGISPVFQVE